MISSKPRGSAFGSDLGELWDRVGTKEVGSEKANICCNVEMNFFAGASSNFLGVVCPSIRATGYRKI